MSDLIDRQAAIDSFDCTNELIVGGTANAQNVVNYINKVVGKIKDLPSAQQWIPCSERMPSDGENILLCDTRFGNVAIGRLIKYNTSCCWEVDHWDCDIEDWQAWMPLPEPWEGEQP